jgi:hypothetical protein
VASRLYDIGLTGVPPDLVPAIQEGMAWLDEATEKIVRNHTIYGQTLAAYVDPCKLVSETIRSHHERYDGTGYPDGLKGADIPWTARCLSVVVAYVAKISSGLTHESALEYLLQKSESDFDPQALQLFLACVCQSPPAGNLRELRAEELQPGMQLASDVVTPSGLVLYLKGQKLDAETISRLSKQVRSPVSENRLNGASCTSGGRQAFCQSCRRLADCRKRPSCLLISPSKSTTLFSCSERASAAN